MSLSKTTIKNMEAQEYYLVLVSFYGVMFSELDGFSFGILGNARARTDYGNSNARSPISRTES